MCPTLPSAKTHWCQQATRTKKQDFAHFSTTSFWILFKMLALWTCLVDTVWKFFGPRCSSGTAVCACSSASTGRNLSEFHHWSTRRRRQAWGEEKPSLSGCTMKDKNTTPSAGPSEDIQLFCSSTLRGSLRTSSSVPGSRRRLELPGNSWAPMGIRGEPSKARARVRELCGRWSIMWPSEPLSGWPMQYAQPDCLCPTRGSLEGRHQVIH